MATALPLAMAGLGAVGSIQQSAEQSEQMEQQARALERQAHATQVEGDYEASRIRSQQDAIEAQTVSSAAGSGVVVNTGSVLDVIKQNAYNIEMDAQITKSNYDRKAYAMRQEARQVRSGKPAVLGSLLSAGGAGLSGYATGSSLKSSLKGNQDG